MEFTDLSRYFKIKKAKISPFSELRKLKPVMMNQDLEILDEPGNAAYAESLAKKGMTVAPILRKTVLPNYIPRDDFPKRIIFEMTSKCNFLCRMCPQQGLKRPRMDIDRKTYCRVIDEIESYGAEGLWTYHLGESFLHPEFRDILKHIKRKKNLGVIWISTNGEYFAGENLKAVFDSNINYINFSAHAVTKKAYESVVSKRGVFDLVQRNLEKFYIMKGAKGLPRKPFLHCQMIEQETTKNEADEFIRKHYKNTEIVSINMLEYVNFPNNSFGLRQRKRRPLTSCLRVSRGDCFIFSNGSVTLCDAAYNGEISLGNINEKSLYEIWNNQERLKILQLNKDGRMSEMEFCQNCTDYDI